MHQFESNVLANVSNGQLWEREDAGADRVNRPYSAAPAVVNGYGEVSSL